MYLYHSFPYEHLCKLNLIRIALKSLTVKSSSLKNVPSCRWFFNSVTCCRIWISCVLWISLFQFHSVLLSSTPFCSTPYNSIPFNSIYFNSIQFALMDYKNTKLCIVLRLKKIQLTSLCHQRTFYLLWIVQFISACSIRYSLPSFPVMVWFE